MCSEFGIGKEGLEENFKILWEPAKRGRSRYDTTLWRGRGVVDYKDTDREEQGSMRWVPWKCGAVGTDVSVS